MEKINENISVMDISKENINGYIVLIIVNISFIFGAYIDKTHKQEVPILFFIFVFFILLIVGVSYFYLSYKRFKLRRIVEDIPTAKIRSIAIGLVEIFGIVMPYNKLLKNKITNYGQGIDKNQPISIFTSDSVIFARYNIDTKLCGKKNTDWEQLKTINYGKYLIINDETGEVLIDTQKADFNLERKNELIISNLNQIKPNIKQFLDNIKIVDIKYMHMPFDYVSFIVNGNQLRISEYLIKENDKIYILGNAQHNPFIQRTSSQKNSENIMIQDGLIYYISDKTEQNFTVQLKKQSFVYMISGFLLVLGNISIILYITT